MYCLIYAHNKTLCKNRLSPAALREHSRESTKIKARRPKAGENRHVVTTTSLGKYPPPSKISLRGEPPTHSPMREQQKVCQRVLRRQGYTVLEAFGNGMSRTLSGSSSSVTSSCLFSAEAAAFPSSDETPGIALGGCRSTGTTLVIGCIGGRGAVADADDGAVQP
eukprot:RCo020643